jgi:hypothetical protein
MSTTIDKSWKVTLCILEHRPVTNANQTDFIQCIQVHADLRLKAVILDQSEGLDNVMASIANNDRFPLQAIIIKRRINSPFLAWNSSYV